MQKPTEANFVGTTTSQTHSSSLSPCLTPGDKHDRRLLANVHPPDWVNPIPDGRYNLVVIGGGSAGLVAAAGAAGLGAKVALVEKHLLGGDCLNVGCVPSKSLIRSARVFGDLALASDLGVMVPDAVTLDFGVVMERVRGLRAEISEHDSAQRFADLGVDIFLGEGRFIGPEQIEVAGQVLDFKKALIATGSRPMRLPIQGLEQVGYLTNESIFELRELPRRLAVIGAGPIGAELAQAFRRFGSELILFDMMPRVLGREDQQAAAIIQQTFRDEGIVMALGSRINQVLLTERGRVIQYAVDGARKEVVVDAILVAAGRTPNVESLNLEAAGVTYHDKGIIVDDGLCSANPNIFAAGDVALKHQFTHMADATARIVLQNALFPGPRKKLSDLVVPWSTYTDPEVAHVGIDPQEAEEAGPAVETFVQAMADVDRGRTDGETGGFVKIHVRRGSDQILGATIVARHAGEMINELTLAMATGTGLKKLAGVIHPYPTQSEAIKKVADQYNRTRLTPRVKSIFRHWLAWRR